MSSVRGLFRLRYSGIFSKAERKHIILATMVVAAVGVSLSYDFDPRLFSSDARFMLILLPCYVFSFLGHELAHKLVARRNGLWAEFRTNTYGLMMTLVSAVFPIKFLAPGQTNVQGEARQEVLGAIALIGPGFNILTGLAAFALFVTSRGGELGLVSIQLTLFNSWLAIFNLLPFGAFDGEKIFVWDKTRWAISFSAALALTIASLFSGLILR